MKHTHTMSPTLFFEFADKAGKRRPLLFQHPVKQLVAETVGDVIPVLQQVATATANGYYAAGYMSYEAAPAFDPQLVVKDGERMPLAWFGLFERPEATELPCFGGSFCVSDWLVDTERQQYDASIRHIQRKIAARITEQVNYTTRLHATFTGDEVAYYRQLCAAQKAAYSAYLNLGRYRVLSISPEMFFRWDGEQLVTRPMKGTIRRGVTLAEDEQNKKKLQQSNKDRVENRIVVDLFRRELSKVAEDGAVDVTRLYEVETYPTVLQMTSTVVARTRPDATLVELFRALFPSGSITGAPKRATMTLIQQLENAPREVYCGAIGYIEPGGEAVFNVPIRTVVIDTEMNKATYGVGGGITRASTAAGEYDELVAKASFLKESPQPFQLLETMRLEDGAYALLERHLHRLQRSAHYFRFVYDEQRVRRVLAEKARQLKGGKYRVRLLLSERGSVAVESTPLALTLKDTNEPFVVALAHTPIDKANRFLYHKTTRREVYERHRKLAPSAFDVLLWNEAGELTEFTIGNLVVELAGKKYTPPVSSGLLAGTFREQLLEEGVAKERVLTVRDLKSCEAMWLVNSVRGWVPVKLGNA